MTASLSVIVPVYNEALVLEQAVHRILSFVRLHFPSRELIIVESGSTDDSGARCDALAASCQEVRVIHEGERRGFGSAMRVGYAAARNDLVWLVTVDIPFPLEAILQALPLLERFDCVLSYRSHDARSWMRRVQSSVYNVLVQKLLGVQARHVNSAFKLFKREVVASLPLQSNGWFFDAELLFRIQQEGARWTEIPVEVVVRDTGRSSVGPWAFLGVFREMVAFRLRNRV
jgi:glycosyltransferase involved in cell wall biosynthesis